MKFTGSDTWNMLARAAGKFLQTKIYFRTVNALNIPLATGTWTEITQFLKPISEVSSKIEYQIGQYSIGSLQLESQGSGAIEYFKNNVFIAPTNLVTNGNFETNTTGWTAAGSGASITRVTSAPMSGVAEGNIQTTTTNTGAYYQYLCIIEFAKF